jgi:hypothetical protein
MALSSDADSDRSDVDPPLTFITLGVLPHGSTSPTILVTIAASNPMNPSETDTSNHDAVQELFIDTQDEGASPFQGMKAKDQEHEKARLVEWASSLTLKDVVLTMDGLDVETFEVCKWSELKCYVKQAFLQANNTAIARAHCKNKDLGKNVANEINSKGYKHKIKPSLSKKHSSTTKPDCMKVDGTCSKWSISSFATKNSTLH